MRRLLFLMALFYLIQLFAGNPALFSLPLELYLKETLGYSASDLAWFTTAIVVPWTVKPLWGLITDSYPLFGSRVRGWFVLCYVSSLGVLLLLGSLPAFSGEVLLVGVGLVSTLIAISDVVTDKLMVIRGLEEGETGSLQAAQWGALSFGGAALGYLGGWLAQHTVLSTAFYLTATVPCAGLLAVVLVLRPGTEPSTTVSLKQTLVRLRQALQTRQYLLVLVFVVALKFHLYPPLVFYFRDTMQFGKQFIGVLDAIRYLFGGLGCICFGMVYKKISRRGLLNWAVGFNALSTLGLLGIVNEPTALLAHAAIGMTEMMGLLGILELAARACPTQIEGTAYAVITSGLNLAERPGRILGGVLWDRGWAFGLLVVVGTFFTVLCWFLIPLLNLEEQIPGRTRSL